jgi:hypothetical protein
MISSLYVKSLDFLFDVVRWFYFQSFVSKELKQKDDLYVKTLKKDAEDVDLLIERMKEQTRNMRKFYFEELTNIEVNSHLTYVTSL